MNCSEAQQALRELLEEGPVECENVIKQFTSQANCLYGYYNQRDLTDLQKACIINGSQLLGSLCILVLFMLMPSGRRVLAPRRHTRWRMADQPRISPCGAAFSVVFSWLCEACCCCGLCKGERPSPLIAVGDYSEEEDPERVAQKHAPEVVTVPGEKSGQAAGSVRFDDAVEPPDATGGKRPRGRKFTNDSTSSMKSRLEGRKHNRRKMTTDSPASTSMKSRPEGEAPKAAEGGEVCLGIDADVVVRFCRLGFLFGTFGSSLSAVLLPMYRLSKGDSEGFAQFTILNMATADREFLWLVVGVAYLLTFALLMLLRMEWRHFVNARRLHLLRRAQGQFGASAAQAQLSVMIERVPRVARTSDEEFGRNLGKVFEGEDVHSTQVQSNTRAMHRVLMFSRKRKLVCNWRNSRNKADFFAGVDKGFRSIMGLKTQAAKVFSKGMLDAASGQPPGGSTSTAFVTFKKAKARAVVEQVILFNTRHNQDMRFDDWLVLPAPERREMIWENASLPIATIQWRTRLTDLLCCVGAFFWSTFVIAVWQLANLGDFEKYIPWGIGLMRELGVYDLVVGYVPVFLLVIALVLLPFALEWFSVYYEGLKSRSEVARKVLRRNFLFQLVTLYTIVISGEIWTTMIVTWENPSCLVALLSYMFPSVSAYFIIFILIGCGTSLPFQLLCPLWQLIPYWLGWRVTPMYFAFGSEAASIVVVLVLGLAYSVIAPAILPACTLYFGLAWVAYRWLFRNVYEMEFDCCGLFWYDLFDMTMLGLTIATFLFACLLGAYTHMFGSQTAALWALPVLVVYCWYMWNKYYRPFCEAMPLEDAMFLENDKRHTGCARIVELFDEECYLDPVARLLKRPSAQGQGAKDAAWEEAELVKQMNLVPPKPLLVLEEVMGLSRTLSTESLPSGFSDGMRRTPRDEMPHRLSDCLPFLEGLLGLPAFLQSLLHWRIHFDTNDPQGRQLQAQTLRKTATAPVDGGTSSQNAAALAGPPLFPIVPGDIVFAQATGPIDS